MANKITVKSVKPKMPPMPKVSRAEMENAPRVTVSKKSKTKRAVKPS